MANICPRCHKELEEDTVCCAELRHTWRCRACGKLTAGFVVPYGRCHMCGGRVEIVQRYRALDAVAAHTVEEAVRFEVEMYQFYKLARTRATDAAQRSVFEQLYLKEQDHLEELEQKYHVHLDPRTLETPLEEEPLMASWIFEGIDLTAPDWSVRPLYEKAIGMERRTRDHFARRAVELPEGTHRDVCRELAAEEEEHIAILETELALMDTEAAIGS